MNDTPPDVFTVANLLWETTALVPILPDPKDVHGYGVDMLKSIAVTAVDDGGGSSANTMCALAACGKRVGIVGHVGSDPEGEAAMESMRRHNVVTRVSMLPGRRTKRSAIVKEIGTDRGYFVVWLPPDSVPPPPEPPPFWLTGSRLLHLDRVSEASPRWARQRFELGLATSLDLHTCPHRRPAIQNLLELLPYLNMIQMSQSAATELASHFGDLGLVALAHRLSATIPWVVFTLGSGGALWADQTGVYSEGAAEAAVVDSTGAGDAFAASLVCSWLAQLPLADAIKQAVVAGARACEFLGARGWLFDE
ncbi:MAG: hypothetical protein HUU55_17415 [Myxococcales bacterium]|nr:hypothetical protein [Myxococcales bacterium]